MSDDKSIAGHFVIGDGLQQGNPSPVTIHYVGDVPWQNVPPPPPWGSQYIPITTIGSATAMHWPFATEDELRAFIRAEVRAALEDDAREIATNRAFQPVDTHQHRRIEMTEENGLHWRGVLYATNAEPLFTPLSGVCWGCLKPGTDMQWYSRDGRSHLIHKSETCRQLAAEKQETTEHRG